MDFLEQLRIKVETLDSKCDKKSISSKTFQWWYVYQGFAGPWSYGNCKNILKNGQSGVKIKQPNNGLSAMTMAFMWSFMAGVLNTNWTLIAFTPQC